MTSISSEPFGTLPSGEEVTKYTVTSSAGLSFSVMDWGATLISVKVPDRTGELREVTLGFDTLEEYVAGHPLMGSTVGRFANRIAGGGFEIDGVRYDLETVSKQGVHIHGGKTGFAKQMWNGDGTVLHLTSADGHEGYPGELAVTATFVFSDPHTLQIRYEATTTKPTHVNLTNHVYWNLGGRGSGEVLDQQLQISADQRLETEENVPTGRALDVSDTPFDFRELRPIGEQIAEVDRGYDHFYLVEYEREKLRELAIAIDLETGIRLEISTNQSGGQLYTGNYLKPPFGPHHGFCLETQHPPNAPNETSFPSTLLRPGEQYVAITEFRFMNLDSTNLRNVAK